MNSQEFIYTAVRKMLIDANLGYNEINIAEAQQSNMVFPEINEYCTFQEISRTSTSITPILENDGENEATRITRLDKIGVQVDFYGEISVDASSQFVNYLMGLASNYLLNNYRDVTIGELIETKNLTLRLDRGKFARRYVQRFNIYVRQILEITQPMFDNVNLNLHYTDVNPDM